MCMNNAVASRSERQALFVLTMRDMYGGGESAGDAAVVSSSRTQAALETRN